ncbi:PREDICTED: uncharacterized protein LOC106814588 [Priapulus caudatus]|uniref:Uncharacterized protein LOC106814588 n=1 Tax=Priapulus caudatus TaxID=37621 RepID=A0ABM1EQE5_PRICU|nr:PREDICTED: uncharacterized protein LOC106814588 [Priapulus caudatus]
MPEIFSPATDRQKRGKRARIRWFLALTLHRNPNLVALRKRHLGELRYRCAMEEAMNMCLMVGNSIAICITFLMMLHFLASYRNDLLQLYRGRYNHLAKLNNVSFMAASLRVNGYQVAYGTWGFAIQSFLIGVTLFLLCEIVIFVKNYGTGLFLLKTMGNVG